MKFYVEFWGGSGWEVEAETEAEAVLIAKQEAIAEIERCAKDGNYDVKELK